MACRRDTARAPINSYLAFESLDDMIRKDWLTARSKTR